MSTQVGTSRAGRTSKDKHAKSTVTSAPAAHNTSQNKTEKTALKNQATVEQMRIAQMIDSGKDSAANIDTVKQLCEMTGRSEDEVIVALHDAKDDADKAVEILLEGGGGEWEVQDKKKKRSNTLKSEKDSAVTQDTDRGDTRPDRSRDRYDYDRSDAPPRRGGRDRRNGGPIPRLANRGRGRERNNYRGDRDRDRSGNVNEKPNYNDRNTNTFNGEEDWEAEVGGGGNTDFREQRRGDRDSRGFGGDRGRGRGRGGGFGRPSTSRGGRPRRFDRPNESPSEGPYIDTWTNETATKAEKENTAWGETWGESPEDWADDQWTGTLEDTKVFTPSQSKAMAETDMPALNDTTNTLGQRLEIGSLFSKSSEFAKAPDFTKTGEPTSGDSFFTNYNQQAAESIKNSIGIGSSARQNLSNIPASQPQSLSQLPAMPQRDMGQSSRSAVSSMLPSTSAVPTSAPLPSHPSQASQPAQPQQRRAPRSKMPPPSKIPASAVEMPGHMMPNLDVQFGVDFVSDSNQYGFGSTGDTNSSYSSASPPSSSSLGNHLRQADKAQQDSNRQTNIMSSPSAGSKPSQNSMPPMDVSPSRPSVFPNSVYTTPTKSDSAPNKVAEPIPYPSSVSDHKSGGLINTQITTQSPSALSQGSMSTSKPDTSNFSVANGYPGNSYNSHSAHSQSHKSGPSASQAYPHSAAGSQTSQAAASYPNQYSSQTQYSGGQQNQYPSANQSQYQGSQSQFPAGGSAGGSVPNQPPNQYMTGQSQYPGGNQGSSFPSAPVVTQSQYQGGGNQYHNNYQSSSSSFQSQQGGQSAAQNSLYPNTTQQSAGSYQSASGSFHVRDSQSAGSLQQSPGNQPNNSYQAQQANQPNNSYQSQQSNQPGNNYQNQPPAPGLNKATTTQNANTYNTSTFSSQHGQSLQTSPLSNKLGDSLSKMTLKDASGMESRSSQYDHGNNSTTAATTNSPSVSTTTSTVSATSTPVATSSSLNSRASTLPVTTKAPPNLPPGVPLVNPHLFMGQPAASGLPPYFGMQQPLYGYEDLQMLQQRLPLLQQTGNYYDLTAYSGVPSTIATGRDQTTGLATAPFTGAGTDNKQMNRVEAQSPSQSNQQQSGHNAPQQQLPFNIHYGYYYPGAVLPGAASFQYPTMFPMPPVTNAAAAAAHVPGTTTAAQLPKTYGSHQGFPSKGGYDEVSGGQDLTKVAYAGVQQQAKVAAAAAVASRMSTRTGSTADMNAGAYTKSHTQGFDKQGFPGGTPPPFNLPMANASQAGQLAAPAAPYGAPFLPMMPPQAHNQTILHHALQQAMYMCRTQAPDRGAASSRQPIRASPGPLSPMAATGATSPTSGDRQHMLHLF
ncbi:protein lingerer-like isoform X4 [Littorina saxatilis]|uniref:protein lingerer-like isoform X4 n=1 Tax=Littorina saxatilis TaxID=31220 RepID=UPI0038B52873